jgi:PIN domain
VANFVAVFDACVLYPASVRDLLLRLALTDLFRARWTDRIQDEWIGAVLKQRQDLTRSQLGRTRDLMNRAVPDCLVTSYESLIDGLHLPDPNDRHVLAAAIRCQAGVIVSKRHSKAVLTAGCRSDLVAPIGRGVVDLVDPRAGRFRGGDRRVEAVEKRTQGFA